jgi:hypothetical protein
MSHVDSKQRVSTILRLAWSDFPLHAIRGIVETSIAGLLQLEHQEVLGCVPLDGEHGTGPNPVNEALSACCDELRDGCGIPVEASLALREYRVRQLSQDWAKSYEHALVCYRTFAETSLQAAFSALR